MSEVDRADCRRAAAECIELARATHDPDTKEALLIRGQEWLKLAYSDHDAEFDRLLAGFNTRQMGLEQAQPPMQRMPMRQQELQQQQSKAGTKGK